MNIQHKKTILVAPLNWGLGHATRCIPIIENLLAQQFEVLLGSDGDSLKLLQKEFPQLASIELPSYNITYPEDGLHFRRSMITKLPHIQEASVAEKKIVKQLVENNAIDGIISDNRLGVYSPKVPSVYMTHQVNVLTGNTTFISTRLHQKIIKKFDTCWVPDVATKPNLSGKLGHSKKMKEYVQYIGPLSRMKYKELPKKYNVLLLLSGPEPQRSLLEDILVKKFIGSTFNVLLVQGNMANEQTYKRNGNITTINYLTREGLETAINSSEIVISRSGYSTIMDLSVMRKKVFFIPTPGQFEQEYLAKRFMKKRMVPCCKQENFSLKKLEEVHSYSGLQEITCHQDLSFFSSFFKGERKFTSYA